MGPDNISMQNEIEMAEVSAGQDRGYVVGSDNSNPSEFMTYQSNLLANIFKPLGNLYNSLYSFLNSFSKNGKLLIKDNFIFFVLTGLTFLLFSPDFIVTILTRANLGLPSGIIEFLNVKLLPNQAFVIYFVFIITFFISHKYKLMILLLCSIFLLPINQYTISFESVSIFILFILIIYGIAKLPIQRSISVAIACTFSLILIALHLHWPEVRQNWDSHFIYGPILIPMVWYSVYQNIPPRKSLSFWKFLIYH